MHVETSRSHQVLRDGTERTYERHLLRRSFRDGGKVRKETLANLSHLPPEAITGPGLGGHCIPIDPFYLTWAARRHGLNTRFIELAGEVNMAMPRYVVDRTAEALNDDGKAVRGIRIVCSAWPTRRTWTTLASRRPSRSWRSCRRTAPRS